MLAHITNNPVQGYWCVCCQRMLPAEEVEEDVFMYVHDDVDHPDECTFDEEQRPQ